MYFTSRQIYDRGASASSLSLVVLELLCEAAGSNLSCKCHFDDLRKIANCPSSMQTLSRRCLHFNQFHCIFDDDSNHCKIHLQSAVSALLCSELVLTHLAAQWIIKMLFRCNFVVSYSSKSIEQCTASVIVSDLFIFCKN